MLYKEDLDLAKCGHPGCDKGCNSGPMVLRSRCHPEISVFCQYERGVMGIYCAACGQPITFIAVASRLSQN